MCPKATDDDRTYVGDDSVERATCVAKPVLARRKLPEVLRRPWHDIVVELEDDTSRRPCIDSNVKLRYSHKSQSHPAVMIYSRRRWPCGGV